MKRPENDMAHHQGQRKELVKKIREKGITDENVLHAIEVVPRHFFVPAPQQHRAYTDKALPIEKGQTISQPYTVAYQTQLLEVQPTDKILEIGTGSAYQACVLAQLGARVYTIERQKKLYDKYVHFPYLVKCGNLHFSYGDGHEGLPQFAPFDKILITAASSIIPPDLISQLKIGGWLVMPLGPPSLQQMVRITRTDHGIEKEYFHHFSFVPMLEGQEE